MTHVLLNDDWSVPKIPRTDVESPSGNVVTSRRGGGSSVRHRFHESSSTRGSESIPRVYNERAPTDRKNREIPWRKRSHDTSRHTRLRSDFANASNTHVTHRDDMQRRHLASNWGTTSKWRDYVTRAMM